MGSDMKYYMVVDSQDYADEFDYPILSIFNEAELAKFKAVKTKSIENGLDIGIEHEIYFGSNEALNMTVSEMIDYIDDAQEITEVEYNFINDNGFIGLDIFEYASDIMIDY